MRKNSGDMEIALEVPQPRLRAVPARTAPEPLDTSEPSDAQLLALCVRHLRADQFVKVGLAAQISTPSSNDASLARPLRVRVFTVPSGRPRYSATSLCDMPLQ